MKKTLAIFDLTDCEGCEIQLLALRNNSDFKYLNKFFNITSWRLATDDNKNDNFDVAFVEGSPVSHAEIATLKQLRKKSKILIAMGACACIGGIPAILDERDREKLIKYVYGNKYKVKAIDAKPLNHYIDVDYYLSGCPINPQELKELLANIAHDKPLKTTSYNVCFECKAHHNDCLFLDGKPCLGAITKAGCGAICPSKGLRCYGCWGEVPDANFQAMIIALKKQGHHKAKIKKIFDIFFEESSGYQKYLKNPKTIKIKIKI